MVLFIGIFSFYTSGRKTHCTRFLSTQVTSKTVLDTLVSEIKLF